MNTSSRFYFVVEYSNDGIFWDTTCFQDYDTAMWHYSLMKKNYKYTRMREV